MTILEAIEKRHSVRSYLDKKIPLEVVEKLQEEMNSCNKEGNLHIQLVTNEPKAFDGMLLWKSLSSYAKIRIKIAKC